MSREDIDHFATRARREREAAEKAADPSAAAMHAELAQRYAAVAEAFAALDRTRTGQS